MNFQSSLDQIYLVLAQLHDFLYNLQQDFQSLKFQCLKMIKGVKSVSCFLDSFSKKFKNLQNCAQSQLDIQQIELAFDKRIEQKILEINELKIENEFLKQEIEICQTKLHANSTLNKSEILQTFGKDQIQTKNNRDLDRDFLLSNFESSKQFQ